jgi:SAM-dependent methyltransferase
MTQIDSQLNIICNICGNKLEIQDMKLTPDMRESLVCKKCGSISRDRMMVFGFQEYLSTNIPLAKMAVNKKFRILETSGSRGHPLILDHIFDYYNIFYEPEILRTSEFDKRKFGDLQHLNFDDNFFDIIFCSDVFEHVRLYEKAFTEVFRVLKKGGMLVLQVPYLGFDKKNQQLVKVHGDTDIFLTEPQYHDANTLVYQIFGGLDLFPELWNKGFYVRLIEREVPEHGISWQQVINCLKL